MKRGYATNRSIRLACVDFGGQGPGLLLLHGLMGRATTWVDTARWLTPHFHVVGLDQRGHGLSDKPDCAYSRDDYVSDAAAAIEQLGLGPAVVVGHSLGALNAWVLAARRPDLVRGVVLEDMGMEPFTSQALVEWREWFASWPNPFGSLGEVRRFFGDQRPAWADYFIEVMQETPEGYRPWFAYDHMLQSLEELRIGHGDELASVRCPALVVKGSESDLPRKEAHEMVRRLPDGRYAEVEGAAHVVHYDQPEGWRQAVEPFLLGLV